MTRTPKVGGRRSLMVFGPGTIAALAVGGFLVVAGRLVQPPLQDKAAGRVVFQADASGKLKRVSAPAADAIAQPLWKPEPNTLLAQKARLHLTSSQLQQIRAVNDAWRRQKADLMEAMNRAVAAAKPSGAVSASQISAGLKDYSDLSREYNARREFAWRMALAVLKPQQMKNLARLIERGTLKETHHD
ncbi:MAG: hypothetical protein ACP5VE_14785 [Chthonomonadales bacterium]